jgi:hypothetical protein
MYQLVGQHRGDFRDFVGIQADNEMRLYPYAKDLFYHPSGILSMTVEIYNDTGFEVGGSLREFLDQLWDKDE